MLLEIILAVVVALPLLYFYATRTYGYWKKLGVPYVEPVPLFGSSLDAVLFRRTFTEIINSIYEKGRGNPCIGYFEFQKPTLMVRDPEMIKMIMIKNFNYFHDNTFFVNPDLDPVMAKNTFFLKGGKWKAVRSLLSPAFTIGKIKPEFPLMASVCKEMVEYLDEEAPKNRQDGLEAKELCAKYTTEVVASCAFGIRGNSFKDPDAEIRKMARKLLTPNSWQTILITLSFISPSLGKLLRVRLVDLGVYEFFLRIVREVLTHREQNKEIRNDFLQMMLEIKQKGRLADDLSTTVRSGGMDIEYTDEDATAHALSFLIDGLETSSVTLNFALYELGINPDVQEQLRTEVKSVLKKYQGELSYEALQEMVYLDMVLSETLRMHPPFPSTDRQCTKTHQLQLPSGRSFTMEKGTRVFIPIESLHHDPDLFPEPLKFNPERFSEENRGSFHRYSYIPFGDGPRQCLGMKFAQVEIKAALATIVSRFEIRKTPKTPVPLILDPYNFVRSAKGGMWLDFARLEE